MIAEIALRREEVRALCRRFGGRRLALFGSAARDDFDPERSDLDFLYEFEAKPPGGYADAFFGLKESSESLDSGDRSTWSLRSLSAIAISARAWMRPGRSSMQPEAARYCLDIEEAGPAPNDAVIASVAKQSSPGAARRPHS